MAIITGSVGRGGVNRAQDIRLVQRLLNDVRSKRGERLFNVNGAADSETTAAIEQYQNQNGLAADGRIEPDSPTLRKLVHAFLLSLAGGFIYPEFPAGTSKLTEADLDSMMGELEQYLALLGS